MTAISLNLPVVAWHTAEYYVGVVIGDAVYHTAIVNCYIPPTTSDFGPSTAEGYQKTLENIQEWIWTMQMQIGTLSQIVWVGDFNARMGPLMHTNSPDMEINTRGRTLARLMPSWGY
jgi:hypothetical protein